MHTEEKTLQDNVHAVLAHSYIFYFVSFLAGLLLHFLLPIRIYQTEITVTVGLIFLLLATILIVWAQSTSHKEGHRQEGDKDRFRHGPYCYTRTPTHWGLFFLMFGFGLVINSMFVVLLSVVSMVLTRLLFIRKEESILARKYGEPYLEYKRSVRL